MHTPQIRDSYLFVLRKCLAALLCRTLFDEHISLSPTMDPVSILSLVSASLTITMRAATIGKDLHSLRTKFRAAYEKIRQLSIHVSAIRLAARSLSS